MDTTDTTSRFQALHRGPAGFVMPNAWDVGSAVVLADAGFAAIATTSAGIAFSLGKPDHDARWVKLAMTREAMFDRIRQMTSAVSLPMNGDLEDGYGRLPEDVAETIAMAIDAGLAGGNIEDKDPMSDALYDESLAVERIRAAREAIDARRSSFVLTARTDAFLVAGERQMDTAVRCANLFREAGADCLYPPGVADLESIQTLVRDISGPLNVVTGLGGARVSPRALLDAGVRRVSIGGAMARAALGFIRRCAAELHEHGTIGFADIQISQSELNAFFANAPERHNLMVLPTARTE